jgi:RNA polymerase sigma-70 factor (ECF subfamily)
MIVAIEQSLPGVADDSTRPMEHERADDDAAIRKRLVALLTRHQRQIFSYIYVLVPNRADAEDLLQETSLVVCE